MKNIFITMAALFVCLSCFGQDRAELRIMFWNLENFFDYFDEGKSDSDKEFSAHGARHWGKKKFLAKCNAVAKTILWVGDHSGEIPDMVAFAEVENRFVLRKLIEETPLRKYDYRIVHYDSHDPRGIDVALIYRESSLELLESRPIRVHGTESQPLQTRDILLAEFRPKSPGGGKREDGGDGTMTILVNHHPSKYGGGDTDWRRNLALARLKAVKDSLAGQGKAFIVATGDFNDTPENTVFQADTVCPFINLASPLAVRGEGTIRYNGIWELIDMFMVTPKVLLGMLSMEKSREPSKEPSREPSFPYAAMEILHVPFLTVRDNTHSGEKPLRTYSGPRYLGGVSDHRPILLRLAVSRPTIDPWPGTLPDTAPDYALYFAPHLALDFAPYLDPQLTQPPPQEQPPTLPQELLPKPSPALQATDPKPPTPTQHSSSTPMCLSMHTEGITVEGEAKSARLPRRVAIQRVKMMIGVEGEIRVVNNRL